MSRLDQLPRRGAALGPGVTPVVLVHGRGRDPDDMFGMVEPIAGDPAVGAVAWLAPAAPEGSWYPESFLAPEAANQPWLDRSLGVVSGILDDLAAAGHPAASVVLVGFSQGACLVAEHVLRRPQRYGGVVVWTGGDITNPPAAGGLDGTPVYASNGDADDWVPEPRSARTAEALRRAGAAVTYEVFPGRDHVVLPEEVAGAGTVIAEARRSTHA